MAEIEPQENLIEEIVDESSCSDTEYEIKCRICFDGINIETDKDKILAPCDCRGSMAYLHRECLKEWSKNVCELCGFHFFSKDPPFRRRGQNSIYVHVPIQQGAPAGVDNEPEVFLPHILEAVPIQQGIQAGVDNEIEIDLGAIQPEVFLQHILEVVPENFHGIQLSEFANKIAAGEIYSALILIHQNMTEHHPWEYFNTLLFLFFSSVNGLVSLATTKAYYCLKKVYRWTWINIRLGT